MTRSRIWIPIVLLLAARLSAQSEPHTDRLSDSAAQAFDRRVEQLSIQAKPVVEVLAELGKRAGVPITVEDKAVELLPWGRETKLRDLTISNATIREALDQIIGALGLEYLERDGEVVVVASRPLERMNRRATWEDLSLLRKCNETSYSPEAFKQFQLQYRITSKVDAPALLAGQLGRAGRGSVAQMLEVAAGSLGWTWFPDRDHLVIMTNQAQIAHRLARRITCRYLNQSLTHIVTDLARRADIPLMLEPGMMTRLPPSVAQSSNLVLQHSSIRQAFEVLCAETGMKYQMRRDGLFVGLADKTATGAAGQARRSPYVCKISVPSKDGSFAYEFLVREDELPADIVAYRRQIIEATIEKMRSEMAPDASIKSGGTDG